jgi:dihydroorotate dehydrogenase (fumarate)
MHSLFEEEINAEICEIDHALYHTQDSFIESESFFPKVGLGSNGVSGYIKKLEKLKSNLQIPVIASLNGVSSGNWLYVAKDFQNAGADAIELNIYLPSNDIRLNCMDIENIYINEINQVASEISIPLAVKITPFFSSLPNFAKKVETAGAKAITLYNRFYTADIDLDTLEWTSTLCETDANDLSLSLRALAKLCGKTSLDMAASGGIKNGLDMIKVIMAGAKVASIASILIKNSPNYAKTILDVANAWMVEHEYESYQQMCGSISFSTNHAALERSNYVKLVGKSI